MLLYWFIIYFLCFIFVFFGFMFNVFEDILRFYLKSNLVILILKVMSFIIENFIVLVFQIEEDENVFLVRMGFKQSALLFN